jgi:polyphenol oxidase
VSGTEVSSASSISSILEILGGSRWEVTIGQLVCGGFSFLVAVGRFCMYRQMVSNSKNAQLFHGSAYCAGDDPDPGAGSLESSPHNNIHLSTYGAVTRPCLIWRTWRTFTPMVEIHSFTLTTRMWTIWKTLGGKRKDFKDPDWLNSSFIFHDENAQPVRVYVKDCLETKKL